MFCEESFAISLHSIDARRTRHKINKSVFLCSCRICALATMRRVHHDPVPRKSIFMTTQFSSMPLNCLKSKSMLLLHK